MEELGVMFSISVFLSLDDKFEIEDFGSRISLLVWTLGDKNIHKKHTKKFRQIF